MWRAPRDELLDGEIFYTLRDAQIIIDGWRRRTSRQNGRSNRRCGSAKGHRVRPSKEVIEMISRRTAVLNVLVIGSGPRPFHDQGANRRPWIGADADDTCRLRQVYRRRN